jgi:hypothetical protein
MDVARAAAAYEPALQPEHEVGERLRLRLDEAAFSEAEFRNAGQADEGHDQEWRPHLAANRARRSVAGERLVADLLPWPVAHAASDRERNLGERLAAGDRYVATAIARAAKPISLSEVPMITRFWFSQLVVAAIAPRFIRKPRTKPIPIVGVAW